MYFEVVYCLLFRELSNLLTELYPAKRLDWYVLKGDILQNLQTLQGVQMGQCLELLVTWSN